MSESKEIKQTNHLELILPSTSKYDIEMENDIWIKNENHQQDNSQSVSELESESSN
jgi:hypothetical protein